MLLCRSRRSVGRSGISKSGNWRVYDFFSCPFCSSGAYSVACVGQSPPFRCVVCQHSVCGAGQDLAIEHYEK